MFVLRRHQLRCVSRLWLGKRLCRSHASSADAQPAAYEEDKKQDLGQVIKPFKQPFLRNLLLGVFDKDFLVYPEVVDLDELQQRTIQNVNLECSKESNALTRISVREKFMNILKSEIPLVADSDYNDSERLRTYELMDIDLQTALLLETQALVINLLSRYGSEQIKSKYLKKLMTGEITGAFAMSENSTGSDPSSLESVAHFKEGTESYVISGTKEWVTNGKYADIYIVLATTDPVHGGDRREVTAFLVDKNLPGITLLDHNSRDLRDCGLVRIKFDKTPVPASNIIGEIAQGIEIAAQTIPQKRYFVLSSLLNTMKKTVKDVLDSIKIRKQFPVPLKDCELVKCKLSEISISIYTVESLIYLYAGMNDSYDIDMTIESASLQMFCYNTALKCLETCNEILGGKSYDGDNHYMRSLGELQGVILACKTQTILQLYVSLMSLKYAAETMTETVRRNRNPLDYPGFVFKKMLWSSKQQSDNPKLTLKLYENLHPSLKSSAEVLEYAVLRLQYAFEIILTRFGNDSVNKQVDLSRIADIMTDIFALTAVLGRASRSYCTGIRFSDEEMLLAITYSLHSLPRIRAKIHEIVDGGTVSNDVGRLKVGTAVLNHGGYFLQHPLVRNIK